MKRVLSIIAICGIVLFSSCSTSLHSMREPNVRVELTASDFELSEQVTGEAIVTRVFGIDWEHLFNEEEGISSGVVNVIIPIIGGLVIDKGANYALYDLMKKNPGYDVVVYPQIESHSSYFIPFFSETTYKVTARLGKLKKQ